MRFPFRPWIACALAALWTGPARAALAPLPDPGVEIRDTRGGRNAPVMGGRGVVFRIHAPDAREASVVGPFNDWDEDANRMRRGRNGVWATTIGLESGRWPYLFVVDGLWIRDPDNPILGVPGKLEGRDLGETSLVQVRHGQVVLPRPRDAHDTSFRLDASYDRVNQVALYGGVDYANRVEPLPELRLGLGYSWGQERVLWDVGVTQPLYEDRAIELGVEAYRRSATPDEFRVGRLENSVGALLFREDWRDYHEAEGWGASALVHAGEASSLVARWRDEDHRSVSKTTDWGLFGGNKRMRVNRPVDEGDLRVLSAGWAFDSRNEERNPTRGWLALATWEWAGGELGGDFRFQRGVADVRRYVKLSPHHYFDMRVMGGLIGEARRRDDDDGPLEGWDAIPVQERFYLGGVGTMRATKFKSLAGDRMALANAEVRWELFRDFQVGVFGDFGDAWVDATEKFDFNADAGIGIQDADANIRVNVARKMDDRPGDDVWVSLRIRRMY